MDWHGRRQSEALGGQGVPNPWKRRKTRNFALGRALADLPSAQIAPAGTAGRLTGIPGWRGDGPTFAPSVCRASKEEKPPTLVCGFYGVGEGGVTAFNRVRASSALECAVCNFRLVNFDQTAFSK